MFQYCSNLVRSTQNARSLSLGVAASINLRMDLGVSVDRKTKIITTVGPATVGRIGELIGVGANVIRINCSHGGEQFYRSIIDETRQAVESAKSAPVDFSDGAREDVCAIAFDTKGPEIRTGLFDREHSSVKTTKAGPEVNLVDGSIVNLSVDPAHKAVGTAQRVFIDYPALPAVMRPGSRIYIDDGLLSLKVENLTADRTVQCRVEHGGTLAERKGVSLPGVDVDLPAVSTKDIADLKLAKETGVDMIFASFVREAQHVQAIRDVVGDDIHIYSKIENQQGIDNFAEILAASDGIMVARGDLGIQIPVERVFLAQKKIIAQCNAAGKPVICATQMLESMTKHSRPTRAEVTDVANAVLDGADAVMLSGETAKGLYPMQTVKLMSTVCKAAEAAYDQRAVFEDLQSLRQSAATLDALAAAAVHAAFGFQAPAIIVVTSSGLSARAVARYRPGCPIIAVSPSARVSRQLQTVRGVQALTVSSDVSVDDACIVGLDACKAMGLAKTGDVVVVVHGQQEFPSVNDSTSLQLRTVP